MITKAKNENAENTAKGHRRTKNPLKKMSWQLHLIIVLPLIFLIVFTYVPMFGLRLAFVEKLDYQKGIWGSKFCGFDWFKYMFTAMPEFYKVFRNTLIIATSKLVLGFPVPIIVSLLLNELRRTKVKKLLQTIYFMPYFLSWVILGSIIKTIFQQGGMFDGFLSWFGYRGDHIWLQSDFSFVMIVIFTDIWKGFGYGAIIYLAALTGIDPTLYEAAEMDGANRFQQTIHVTLPSMMAIIILNLILNLGSVINANFDQIYVLYNPLVYDWGDIIDTYVYRITLEGTSAANYPIGTAIGLFKSVISLILICTSNLIVKKTSDFQIL